MDSIIYLVRHGEIELGGKRRMVGQVDLPLSEEGRQQAHLLNEALASSSFDRIYCSDLIRSLETARIISAQEERIEIVPGLREIDLGVWDGEEVEEIRKAYPEEWEKRESDVIHYRPPGGESFADLARRLLPMFEQIVAREEARVLIVGHAGVNRVILTHILGMPLANLFRLQQDYGSYTLLAHKNAEWRLLTLNTCPPIALSTSLSEC
jgi:probable phosphoglycerate mutase